MTQYNLCEKEKFFYVISYPRSGTTWMVNTLFNYYSAQRSELLSQQSTYSKAKVYLEDSAAYTSLPLPYDMTKPLQVKTHFDKKTFLSQGCPENKTLYLQRDARDVMISYYFYIYGYQKGVKKVFKESEFIDFLHKELPLYKQHIDSWSNANETLIVQYEDLKRNYIAQLVRINNFLENIFPTKTLADVEKECVIKVKQNFTNNSKNFFRRGVVGDWESYFTDKSYSVYESYFSKI